MDDEFRDRELEKAAQSLGLRESVRHIFLCVDPEKPKCCAREAGLESWEFLKRRLKELDRSAPVILRSKAACLKVCVGGPIAVVYPDRIRYHSCTPQVLDRIVEEHLIGGRVVEEFRFAQ